MTDARPRTRCKVCRAIVIVSPSLLDLHAISPVTEMRCDRCHFGDPTIIAAVRELRMRQPNLKELS